MATPSYATVIAQINAFIVTNGNNEITANVLNPILKIITDFANNEIGDLDALTTSNKTNIVNSINSLKNALDSITDGGIQLHTGYDTPTITPPTSYNYGDFYMELDILDDSPIQLWQWNGMEWTTYASVYSKEEIDFIISQLQPAILEDRIIALENAQTSVDPKPNELIEKGFNHIIDFDWYVFAQKYRFNGILYETLVTDIITIDPAPTTTDFKRFDVVVFNDDFTFSVVKGTESLTPAIPKIDILTQIQLTVILVEYGTTEPSYLTKQLMYDEGLGLPAEFAVTKTGASITLNSTQQASSGTKCIKVANPINSDVLFLDKNEVFSSLDVDTISFKVKNATAGAWKFFLYSYNSIGAFYQGTVMIKGGKYGYDSQNITDWQTIIVPMYDLFGGAEVLNTGFAITFFNNTGLTFYFDEFSLNGNFTQAPEVPATHTHSNLSVLEQITQTLFDAWNAASTWITTNGANVLAHLANKQNSLATDGTGAKYPTVDAVNAGLDSKVDDAQVLTNVPAGAVFTDTIYNDSDVLKDADALSAVTPTNKLITESDLTSSSGATATHTQSVAATTWNFAHGTGNPYPVITVWNDLGKVIVPQDITMVDSSNLIITFNVAVAGIATAVVGGVGVGNLTISATPNGLSLTGQELALQLASTTQTGALSNTDWNTFNNKVSAATLDTIETRVTNVESNQYSGVVTYATLAELPTTGTLLVSYKVTNDPTTSNNGYYHWNGTVYVKDADLDTAKIKTWVAQSYLSADQVNHLGKDWVANAATLSTDVPGTSSKWVERLSGYTSKAELNQIIEPNTDVIKKDLINFTPLPHVSSDIDDFGNVYVCVFTTNYLAIFKNGLLDNNITSSSYNNGYVSCAIKILNNKIHILLGTSLATLLDNGLSYVEYDITLKTFTDLGKLSTGLNEKLNCWSIVKFNDELYSAVNIEALSNGSEWDSSSSLKRIDLFKLSAGVWVKQNVIHAYNQEWTGRILKSTGVTDDSIGDAIVPIYGTLFVNEKGNLGAYFISLTGSTVRRFFSKELVSGIWLQERVERILKGLFCYAYVDQYNKRKLFVKRYTDSANTFILTEQIVTEVNGKNKFIITKNENEYGSISNFNGKFVYVTRKYLNGKYYIKTYEVSDKTITNTLNPTPITSLGIANINTIPPTFDLKFGDYFTLNSSGTYKFIDYYELSLSAEIITYIKLILGDEVKLVWNGFQWCKILVNRNYNSEINNIPLQGYYLYNEFGSKNFRIPAICETINKNLIIGGDARLTSVSDYAEIDGVICRSGNGGRDWTNYKTVFKRQNIEGYRVHDLSFTVDKNPNSAQYGRIWVFAKEWLANIDPNTNLQYFVDNPNKTTLWLSYSDDEGFTWSVPVERKDLYKVGSFHMSTGCSEGLTMVDGTLIQPVYWSYSTTDNRSGIIKKIPDGDWQIADEVSNTFGITNENSIIQDTDGKLIMNARTSGVTRKVFEMTSIGNGWTSRPDLEVWQDVNGGCQNSFVRYRNTYLYCQPTSYGSSLRNNIKLFISYDKINWQEIYHVTNNSSSGGYSAIIATDNNFGLLYENTETYQGISYLGLNHLRNLLR